MDADTGVRVWHAAPDCLGQMTAGSIQGAWVAPGDAVEWIWTHTLGGSYVSGYAVRGKWTQEIWSYVDMKKEKK